MTGTTRVGVCLLVLAEDVAAVLGAEPFGLPLRRSPGRSDD